MAMEAQEFQELAQKVEALEKLTKELSSRLWETERQLACLNEMEQASPENVRSSRDDENEIIETSEQPSGLSSAERARRKANRVKAKARKTVDAEKLDEWYAAVDRCIVAYSERGKTELGIRLRRVKPVKLKVRYGQEDRTSSSVERVDPYSIPELISLEPSEVVEEITEHYRKQGYVVNTMNVYCERVIRLSWK